MRNINELKTLIAATEGALKELTLELNKAVVKKPKPFTIYTDSKGSKLLLLPNSEGFTFSGLGGDFNKAYSDKPVSEDNIVQWLEYGGWKLSSRYIGL